jgi:hypothetical protein
VTTGELWQFLKLAETSLVIDPEKLYIESPEKILAMLNQTNKDVDTCKPQALSILNSQCSILLQ